jgi:tetratricopeptide (TPR) repeat protein
MRSGKLSKLDWALLLTVVVGVAGIVALSRRMDAHVTPVDTTLQEESLYVTAATVDRLSLGFNGLLADWYWMRSLQYVGRQILNWSGNVELDNLGPLNLKLLAPLLDAATTLDPQFLEPYQYAAAVLPGVDMKEAVRIIKKGIDANPYEWKLYHHLGYIYWQQKDYNAAGEAYAQGAKLPGAPAWMEVMKARMASEGGSSETARQIYTRIYEEAGDRSVKEMARRRLLQLDAMGELEGLHRLIASYRDRIGRCPESWRDLEAVFRALRVKVDDAGAPLDPAGTPYLLVKEKCEVSIDRRSEVPVR